MLEGTHPWLAGSPSVLSGKNRMYHLIKALSTNRTTIRTARPIDIRINFYWRNLKTQISFERCNSSWIIECRCSDEECMAELKMLREKEFNVITRGFVHQIRSAWLSVTSSTLNLSTFERHISYSFEIEMCVLEPRRIFQAANDFPFIFVDWFFNWMPVFLFLSYCVCRFCVLILCFFFPLFLCFVCMDVVKTR